MATKTATDLANLLGNIELTNDVCDTDIFSYHQWSRGLLPTGMVNKGAKWKYQAAHIFPLDICTPSSIASWSPCAPMLAILLPYWQAIEHGDGRICQARLPVCHTIPSRLTIILGNNPTGKRRLIRPSGFVQDTTNYLRLVPSCTRWKRVNFMKRSVSEYSPSLVNRRTYLRNRWGPANDRFKPRLFRLRKGLSPSRAAGKYIGHVTERFEHLDIALVDLFPSSMFTNNEDFQAQSSSDCFGPPQKIQARLFKNMQWYKRHQGTFFS